MPNGADNLVLSGGLVPPPRRCARNEKKDKRSLVEKEIDTGACLIDAHSTGLADAFFATANSKGLADLDQRQSIAPPKGHDPHQKQDYPSLVSVPLRVLRVFWDAETNLRR